MNATNTNRAPQGCRISNYKYYGFFGRNGIGEARVTDATGRTAARIYCSPQGYKAETPAMSYATEWHATEAAALAALFASGEWAYFGSPANTQQADKMHGEFDPLIGRALQWIDTHPRTASALLWLQALAVAYAVFCYDFTIPMYK
jgi:hypothetical protein